MNVADKRTLVNYLQATGNEIGLDLLVYKMMGITPEEGNYVPRPSKLLKYSNKAIVSIFRIFWIYILSSTLFTVQFLSYLIKKIRLKESNVNLIINNKSVGIAYSDRAIDIINEKNCGTSPEYWIVFPWTDLSRLDKNASKIDVLSLLTIAELWKAYIHAIAIHKKMARSLKYKNWIFQSYTAFQWIVVRKAIEKLEADFFIAEHFDRWAVMMDGIITEHTQRCLKSGLTMVQHGLVNDVGGHRFSLPYKLSMFKRFYLYDKKTEDYFKENILAKKNPKLEDIRFYKNLLTLREIPKTNTVNVLFVGHSICIDLHMYILNELKSKHDFIAYYKPHPTEKLTKQIKSQNWNIIEDRHFFPAVDFLISYNSTLTSEYKLLGINAIIHEIDLKDKDAQSYLEDVEKELNSFVIKKINLQKNKIGQNPTI